MWNSKRELSGDGVGSFLSPEHSVLPFPLPAPPLGELRIIFFILGRCWGLDAGLLHVRGVEFLALEFCFWATCGGAQELQLDCLGIALVIETRLGASGPRPPACRACAVPLELSLWFPGFLLFY